jgi:broad specificity phosphatase PhoE
MAERTLVFLARHASPHNPDGVFYGHLPGFGLGEMGRAEAEGMAEVLAAQPIRKIYTSPLERARETAAVVAHRVDAGNVPILVRDDLLEARFGRYIQGIPRPQIVLRRPLFWVHLLRPGALAIDETVGEMAERVGRVSTEAVEACRGDAALLVSHADPIKALWNRFLGRTDWRFHGLRLPKGSFLEMTYDGDRLVSIEHRPPTLAARSGPV